MASGPMRSNRWWIGISALARAATDGAVARACFDADFPPYSRMALILNRRLQPLRGLVDLAPMLNVILLLLCFFLLSSSFILQPGIKVNLPRSVSGGVPPASRLIVAVTLAPQQYDEKGAPL